MGMFTENELLGWGIGQGQIDSWKMDLQWWALLEVAQLGDKVTALHPFTSGGAPRPVGGYFALVPPPPEARPLPQSMRLKICGYGNGDLEGFHRTTTDRELWRLDETGRWQEQFYPTTFLVAPPVQYEFYFDRNAVEWPEVWMDVARLGTLGITKWTKAPRILRTSAEALNAGVSDTQLALHVSTGDWVATGVDVLGLVPPLAIPMGVIGLGMDLWPGVKVKAR